MPPIALTSSLPLRSNAKQEGKSLGTGNGSHEWAHNPNENGRHGFQHLDNSDPPEAKILQALGLGLS